MCACVVFFFFPPDHPNLEPRHFVDERVVNENHKDYMFLECILFITEVRLGGLFHSETIHLSCVLLVLVS